MVAVTNWTGCYLGAGGGGAVTNNDHNDFVTATGLATGPNVTTGARGWFGTVQGGCDYQFAGTNWLVGAFADYDFMDVKGEDGGAVCVGGEGERAKRALEFAERAVCVGRVRIRRRAGERDRRRPLRGRAIQPDPAPGEKLGLLAQRLKFQGASQHACGTVGRDQFTRQPPQQQCRRTRRIGFDVDDLSAGTDLGRALGLGVISRGVRENGTGFCYFDTREGAGTILEIRKS